jgi:hypothetical protein
MNFPNLPAPPSAINECLNLYKQRFEHGAMPFPRASQLLIAYMAWPNDLKNRNRWMATNMALLLTGRSSNVVEAPTEPSTKAHKRPSKPQSRDQIAFELFGGLRTVADASLSHMMKKLEAIQQRWTRVADVLQMVVDIHYEKRAPIPGGASISKAYDLLLGYGGLPRRARLSKDWSDFRDVSHLIAASAFVALFGREQIERSGASAVMGAVLFVPEVILGIGLAFQEFGLTLKPYRQSVTILPSKTLWRIPKLKQFPILPLPVRKIGKDDLKYLTTVRRARPKK